MNIYSSELFKTNKYTKWYFQIIERSFKRETPLVYEKHHIIPSSIGGKDVSNNFSLLTPREHYLVHLLLTRMCIKTNHVKKMIYAADMMLCRFFHKQRTSRLYEYISVTRRQLQSKRNKKDNSHSRLHSIENTEKAAITKVSRKYTAWNNGVSNINGASNGKRGEYKVRELATGRRRYYLDNTWTWAYQQSDGSWYIREKLTKHCKNYKEIKVYM